MGWKFGHHRQGPECGLPGLLENWPLPRLVQCTSQKQSSFSKVEIGFPLNLLGSCVFSCLSPQLAFLVLHIQSSQFSQAVCLLFPPCCRVGRFSDWGSCFLLSQHCYRQVMAGGVAHQPFSSHSQEYGCVPGGPVYKPVLFPACPVLHSGGAISRTGLPWLEQGGD